MTVTNGSPEDVLMLVSAENAGKDEIENFLRCTGGAPGKRCLKRILKRIKHPSFYHGGRLTEYPKFIALMMILLLVLFFAMLGFFGARLMHDITSTKEGVAAYFAMFASDKKEQTESASINCFMLPKTENAKYRELVRSSLMYNVEFETEDGYIYYLQKVRTNPKEDLNNEAALHGGTESDGKHDDDVFRVLVSDAVAQVTKDKASGGLFAISWSDSYHTYTISGCRTMEQAVRYAKSLAPKDDTTDADVPSESAQK